MTPVPKLIREKLSALADDWDKSADKYKAEASNKEWTEWLRGESRARAAELRACANSLRSLAAEPMGGEAPVAWVRALNGAIDWEEDCLYSEERHFDTEAYPREDGYTCEPVCFLSATPKQRDGESDDPAMETWSIDDLRATAGKGDRPHDDSSEGVHAELYARLERAVQSAGFYIESPAGGELVIVPLSAVAQPDSAEGDAAHLKWMEALEQPKADGGRAATATAEISGICGWRVWIGDRCIKTMLTESDAFNLAKNINEALSAAPQPEQATLPIPSHVYITDKGAIVTGIPQSGWNEESTEAHNCDTNGCGQCHVLYRLDFTDERTQPEQPARDGVTEILASLPPDDFNGDNKKLIASIEALISLDTRGALVPHGIGGHAKALLASAARRLGQPPQQADGGAVGEVSYYTPLDFGGWLIQFKSSVPIEQGTKLYAAPPKSPGVGVGEETLRQAIRTLRRCQQESGGNAWEPYITNILAALGGEK